MERGEGIGRYLWARFGDSGEQRRFAGVRIANEANIGNDSQLEEIVAFIAGLAGLGKAGRLAGSGGEVAIAETAASGFAENESLAVRGEVGHEFAFSIILPGGFLRFVRQIVFLCLHAARDPNDGALAGA